MYSTFGKGPFGTCNVKKGDKYMKRTLQKCKLKEKDKQSLGAHASMTSVLRDVLMNQGMTK